MENVIISIVTLKPVPFSNDVVVKLMESPYCFDLDKTTPPQKKPTKKPQQTNKQNETNKQTKKNKTNNHYY